ncbi:hypothetical protein DFH06DRAFT_1207276 [Mycena polygramma]|nr:hypothetical protein DFH06DRAFT_1207276 [Mycena polygramma]
MLLPLSLLPSPSVPPAALPGFAGPVGAFEGENEASRAAPASPSLGNFFPPVLALPPPPGIAPRPLGNGSVIRAVDGEYQPAPLSPQERRRLADRKRKKLILEFEEPIPRVGVDVTPRSKFIPSRPPHDPQPTNVDPLYQEQRRRRLRKLLEEIAPYSKVTPYRC